MKASLGMFKYFCIQCKEPLNQDIETNVVEIRFGTIKHGIFNRAYNYPALYVHEGCYDNYLKQFNEKGNNNEGDSNKGKPT